MRAPTTDQAAMFAIGTGEETVKEAMHSIGAAIEPDGRASFTRIIMLGAAFASLPEHAKACGVKTGDAARALARLMLDDDEGVEKRRYAWSLHAAVELALHNQDKVTP